MEERRDLESVLPLLPLILRSSSLCWPPPSLHALKALSLGPTISDVASGHVLFDAIVDLRFHLGFSRDRLASSVGDGYVLFFDKLISSIDSRKVARGIHPCLGQLAAASAVSFRGSLSRRRCQFFSSNSSSLVVIARSRENKVKCLLHYFERICTKTPLGSVSFERKVLSLNNNPLSVHYPEVNFWDRSGVPVCSLKVLQTGKIEYQQHEALEVDFANKFLGGGALGQGCVQDEEGASPPRWVRTKVSFEDHIVVPELDETGGEAPEDFVERYASSLIGKPLDKSKPLWEAHLLNVKTKESESTLVIRIHHSLGDGISLMSLFLACTRKASNPVSLPTLPESRPRVSERKPGFVSFLVGLWVFLQVMWYTLVGILVFVATILFYKDSDSLIKGSKGVEFRTKRIVHTTLSLDDIKLIKKAMSATVNDVMLGITSAGLLQYLTRRYEKENGAKEGEKSRILANLRIRSSVLFNTRQTPGLHELSDMMKKGKNKLSWGNRLGYVIIPFSMKRKAHPLDYIREAKAIAGRKKLSLEARFTYASGLLIAKIFGFKIATALCHRMLSNTTFSFSNVVGALEDVELFGHPIVYLAPTVYGHPHALTIHFQSYVNKVKLVLSVDEEAIPDPHQLCSDIAEALSLIRDSINKTEEKIELSD